MAGDQHDATFLGERTHQLTDPAHAVGTEADDRRVAGCGRVKAEDDAHRGGLAGAVRAEEAGHVARLDLEGQVIDGSCGAVVFGQISYLDHADNVAVTGDSGTSD